MIETIIIIILALYLTYIAIFLLSSKEEHLESQYVML